MKGMDLASALAAPVQGRGSGQGARSRSETGNNDAESFDTVFNDVHGVAATAPRQTDDAGGDSAADGAAQGTDYGSAAVQNPAPASGNDDAAVAGSDGQAAGHVAWGLADQPPALTFALGLPVQDGQAPSAAPGTQAATPGPDPRLAVPGALVAATAQQAALQTETPRMAPTPGLQPVNTVSVTGPGAGVPPAAAGGVPAANSAASTITPQGPVAEQTLSVGATSGATSGVASGSAETNPLAVPATGGRSAGVLGNGPAPVQAMATAGTTSSTTTATAQASAVLPTNVAAAGSAAGFPAGALAEGVTSGSTRTGDTAAPAPAGPAPAAPADALAAAGSAAAATAPAGQPTSSTAAAPQPAAPAAPQPGATLQPQLAKPLFTLAGAPQGQHIMTLQVTPEDLGPMTVRAHIDAAGVRIELFAPGDAGREAIRGILPELRKELADAGFGASLDVSEHTGPGNTARDGTSQDSGNQDRAGRDSGSGPGNRNGPGDPRPGHRWEALADGDALRDARILNGPQTTLDILV